MVFIPCFAYGYFKNAKLKERCFKLLCLENAFEKIKSSVIARDISVLEAVKSVNTSSEAVNLLFEKAGEKLEHTWDTPVSVSYAFENFSPFLLNTERAEIVSLFKDIGKGDKDTEKAIYERITVLIKGYYSDAQSEYAKKSRLTTSVSVMMGISAVILLW